MMHFLIPSFRLFHKLSNLDSFLQKNLRILYNNIYVCLEAVGPGMMMYDDFTNEDVGNVIMDADTNGNSSSFNEYNPELRSFPSRRRKRKRNKNKSRFSRPRPGK